MIAVSRMRARSLSCNATRYNLGGADIEDE